MYLEVIACAPRHKVDNTSHITSVQQHSLKTTTSMTRVRYYRGGYTERVLVKIENREFVCTRISRMRRKGVQ